MGVSEKILASVKLLTVEPYLFCVLFAYFIRLVSFQDLLIARGCENLLGYPKEVCDNLETHEEEQIVCIEMGNNLYMSVMCMNSIPAIVVAVFLGPWSDKYTRKYPLIIAVSGMLLENVVGTALTFFTSLSPWWYTVAGLFSGVSGGFIICQSAACSYLSDVTDERSRPARFAVLEFFNISAIICGSVFGGLIYEKYGFKVVMSLPPIIYIVCLLYVILFVKETKPPVPNEKRKEMFRDLLRLDNIKQSYKTCSKKRPGNIRLQLWLLVWCGACQRFADMGFVAVGFTYAKKMYHWSVRAFSDASTVYYSVNAIATVGGIPLLCNKFHLHEAALGLIGILSMMSKMVLTSVAYSGTFFYFAWLSGVLGNASGIALRSRLSKIVDKEELGRVFSLLGTCESVTPLLGTVMFLQIYNVSINFFPGLTFVLAAALLLTCGIVFLWMLKLPTISLTDYAREEEMKDAKPMQIINSSYQKLENSQMDINVK